MRAKEMDNNVMKVARMMNYGLLYERGRVNLNYMHLLDMNKVKMLNL